MDPRYERRRDEQVMGGDGLGATPSDSEPGDDSFEIVEKEAELPVAEANTESEQIVRDNTEYIVKFTAKKKFARLHLRHGCWRSQDDRDAVSVNIEDANYDEICHLCWPKGARPIGSEGASVHNERCAIRVSAGVIQRQGDDDSSSTESSSSSEEVSESEK